MSLIFVSGLFPGENSLKLKVQNSSDTISLSEPGLDIKYFGILFKVNGASNGYKNIAFF